MDQAPSHKMDCGLSWQDTAALRKAISQLNPSLQVLAKLDRQTHLRHMQVSQGGITRIKRLQNPIQTWTRAVGEELGQAKANFNRQRLRRQADHEIDLDNDGDINWTRIDCERENNDAANARGKAEWFQLTRVHIINFTSGRMLT